ncbi:cysteine protease family C48, putative [Phytophthora infestans T30-4]|uniref:Cysteine protease family C48, putative n=1 Tax=Phytophthora infestans (strain T30-4) TaxID=403677 RepID=D0P2L8_PHYIT|nr:cysteine protease family C48, putative [Phytophthora infestans T30-4]EEY56678.1 cysteine protease family C48, putative [Phytophthora infestans T30-4]|eukprot:XP_002895446.1 cysteine protease family C48, putative [Phytophthora infestans T30-4]
MQLRALLRDNDVCDVVSTLWMIMPGVREVWSFLTTFPVNKNGEGRSIQWRVDGDYVPDRVRFRLVESLVDDASDKLRGGLALDEEIELDSDGERMSSIESYVVSIEKVGQFTREQLEAMKSLWGLQDTCRNAVLCCTWLNSTVKPAVSDPASAGIIMGKILECWPYTSLVGFGFDLTYNNLFCFRDSAWLNDNAMRAFAVSKDAKNGTQPKATKSRISTSTLDKVGESVASHQFVLLPINFGGTHWGCLVVDRDTKVIKMYDSMGGKRNKKRLQKMAEEIRTGPLRDDSYEALEVTEPVQTNSDSCGVFVCRFFWTCVSSESPSDVSPAGITKLRWEMLHAVTKLRPR